MPSIDSIIPKSVNPDLQKERDAASFSVEEFATWWHGSADKLKFKRDLEKYLFEKVKAYDTPFYYESYEDVYNKGIENCIEVAEALRRYQAEQNPGGSDIWPSMYVSTVGGAATPAGNPFGVHFVMMTEAIKSQGTDEQFEEFGKRASQFAICGAYAQTELGHGTFLRGLETRADYDRKTQEFVLNTPHITSYKWWPGGLGHSANYCILVAQLYIDNEPKGVHMFFIQIRDEETHLPLPGVDVGDIGARMGFYGVNNGFLGLKNVRVPRKSMLMRNSRVEPDGTYVKSPASVLTYLAMVFTRCHIVRTSSIFLSIGSTIATRYSAVRRQSPINPNDPEPQVIDHVTQQYKLFPEIAGTVAYYLASQKLWALHDQTRDEINKGKYDSLGEMHSLSCSLKALSSYDSTAGIERLRLACGGHGYLTSSGMGPLFANATAACTYEGENTILLLQVGRFLVKSWRTALQGKPLTGTVQYLAQVVKQPDFGKWSGSWENIVKAMQYAAANKTRLAFDNMALRLKSGQTEAEAANNTGIEFTEAAELHGRAFVCASFLENVSGVNSKERSAALNKVLEHLLELYLVNTVKHNLHAILQIVRLTETELKELQSRVEAVLKKIRPDAVAICDGFDLHDRVLRSTLGSYDGNAYERLFVEAKKSPLNKQPVPKSFHTHLKPFLKSNL